MYGTDEGVEAVRQVTTDDRFTVLTAGTGAPHWELERAIDFIIRMADKRDRMIVAWSIHELQIVERYCRQHFEQFQERFVNAKLLAERWKGRLGQPKPKSNTLSAWLALTGYEVPFAARAGVAAASIRNLEPALSNGRAPTVKQRQGWLDLLDHNRHDVDGMRELCLQAAAEIAVAELAPRSRSKSDQ
jgi:hypothetical protein